MRQLTVFQSVASHLSYTRAAADLHLSQPAVSMQIKQLEENLGLPLFEQIGKKIFLTDAGKEMVLYSRNISRQLEEIQEVFAHLQGLESGTLKLTVPGTANAFVTRFLAEFCHRHPTINFQLDIANRKGLIQRLEQNETDLVIMGTPPEGMGLVGERFMDNPLVAIASPDHTLVRQKSISLDQLVQHAFVVREQGSGTRIAMERFFEEHGIELKQSMEMASNESIKQAVAAGLGLGIVSLHTLEMELTLKRIAILKAEVFPIMRHWYIVYRDGKRLSPVAQAFKEFVLNDAVGLWALAGETI
jgi:DNA-binding transcriptional LysR family regulator